MADSEEPHVRRSNPSIGLSKRNMWRKIRAGEQKKQYLAAKANEFYREYLTLVGTGMVSGEEAINSIAKSHDYNQTFVAEAIRRLERKATSSYSPIGPRDMLEHIHHLDESISRMRDEINTQIAMCEKDLDELEGIEDMKPVERIKLRSKISDKIIALHKELMQANQQFGNHLARFMQKGAENMLTEKVDTNRIPMTELDRQIRELENRANQSQALEVAYEPLEESDENEKD